MGVFLHLTQGVPFSRHAHVYCCPSPPPTTTTTWRLEPLGGKGLSDLLPLQSSIITGQADECSGHVFFLKCAVDKREHS